MPQHDDTPDAKPADDDRCTDTHGASRVLDLSVVTLAQWRMKGLGPAFYRFGRQIRYRIADLNEYMASRRVGGEK